MILRLIVSLAFICAGNCLFSQYVFIVPTHYHGIFSGQLSSARAQGMGYTTITLDGIATSIYNPATISPGNNVLDVNFNYASGHPLYPKSRYPFLGISYRVLPKLVVGVSKFSWIDPDSYWTASIQGQEIDTKRKEQHLYSLTAAYAILKDLHFGVSGNFIREQAVNDTTTIKEFMMNAGVIYDRKVDFIRNKRFSNEQIRAAFSLTNALMNAKTEQRYLNLLNYRDLPIIARLGLGYSFSIPAKISFTKGKRFFAESPEILDLSLRLQFQDFLKHKDHIFGDHKYSSAFGIGAEAWFMKLLAFRLGYYTENRSADDLDPGDILATSNHKSGLTWGFGANVPLKRLTGGKVPIDVEANFVTSKMMNELNDEDHNFGDLRDKRFQFCMGLNIRWSGKK